jgi:hypothetical protein
MFGWSPCKPTKNLYFKSLFVYTKSVIIFASGRNLSQTNSLYTGYSLINLD